MAEQDKQIVLQLDSIERVAQVYNSPCYHPMVAVLEFDQNIPEKTTTPPMAQTYGVYLILLRRSAGSGWGYGEKSAYNSQDGSVLAFAPGQYSNPKTQPYFSRRCGIALTFDTQLLRGTVLGRMIRNYPFLHYRYNQGLFLSDTERLQFNNMLRHLNQRLKQEGENLNINYLTIAIKHILDLLMEVYKRNTEYYREETNDLFCNFESDLSDYLQNFRGRELGLPTVEYFAKKAKLTPNHFGDRFKDIIDLNPKLLINKKMRDYAMEMLLSPAFDIAKTSESLGFVRVAHFSRFFHNMTGMSPSEYIKQRRKQLKEARDEYETMNIDWTTFDKD